MANRTNKKSPEPGTEEDELAITEYKIGDFVRATYDVDGIDYEAEIIAVHDDNDECLIRYIGYENEQTVKLADLVDSWGGDEREKQRIAAAEVADEDEEDDSDLEPNELFRKNVKSNLPMPPMPPMPPMLANSLEQESEDFSAMLMAWYMSGYYTGFYQGRRVARLEQQNVAKRSKGAITAQKRK